MTTPAIDTLLGDLRYASRTIRRSPGFTLMAVVSLALGIGANTAIFTLINAVMLRALPVRAPQELVTVGDASRPTALREGGPDVNILSYPLYAWLRDRNQSLSGLVASGRTGRIEMRTDNGAAEEVRGRLVSGNYFDVLGVTATLGRTFAADEDRAPGASPVVVLSEPYWDARFARDPAILGRTLRLNGSPFTIVGVGARGFTGDVVGAPTDIWIPITMQAQVNPGRPRLDRRDANWLLALGRLKPGASVDTARAELTRLAQDALVDFASAAGPVSSETRREIATQRLPVEPGAKGFSWIRKNLSPLLATLMVVVGLVLAIACGNVANLLFTRAIGRQKEIAVRLAVGASRARLVRQLLTETALLAILGGAAGLLIAEWGSAALARIASRGGPNPISFDVNVHPDATVLAFTIGVSVLTALLCGLVPALRATRVELTPSLKTDARGLALGRSPLGKLLVVGQVALSVPLLIGAGLFVRTLSNLETLDVGYARDRLVLVQVDPAASGHDTPGRQRALTNTVIERLRAVPGVAGVTVSENGLFSGVDSGTNGLVIEGFRPSREEDTASRFDQIGPDYFTVVGIPLLAGREFDARDIAGTPPVVVINETMARFYFGTANPLGKTIQNGGDRYTIVGVARDHKQRELKGQPERRFYLPLLQSADRLAALHVEVRTRDDAARLMPTIRGELMALDGRLRIGSLDSARTLMDQSLSAERSIAQLSGFFSVLALVLAAAGLYGLTSYATSRRTKEIGLRMAIGASGRDVVRLVLVDTLRLIAAGLAVGIPLAFAATRLIATTLVGVTPADPAIVGGALLVMAIAGVSAGAVPALRAARIDPLTALRQE